MNLKKIYAAGYWATLIFMTASAHETLALELRTSTPASGQYQVPVQEEALKEFAIFPLKVKISKNQKGQKLTYKLPMEIVGRPLEVKLHISETPTGLTLKGPLASGDCRRIEAKTECKMVYSDNLKINPADVESFLQNRENAPAEFEQRKAVAEIFAADPIGILSF